MRIGGEAYVLWVVCVDKGLEIGFDPCFHSRPFDDTQINSKLVTGNYGKVYQFFPASRWGCT